MKTQENRRAPGYTKRQRRVTLNGERVWCDPELIPLLRELNKAGLITRSHCSGHGSGHAFVVIRAGNINAFEMRQENGYNELMISWQTKRQLETETQ